VAVGRREDIGVRDALDEGCWLVVLFRGEGRCWKVQLLPKRQYP
jgi:hypothetical protein